MAFNESRGNMSEGNEIQVIEPEIDTDSETSDEIQFELAPSNVNVVVKNGVEILVPKRSAMKKCTVAQVIDAIGGSIEPTDDFAVQSTYGDNSRLARKLGVSIRTVRMWREKFPTINQAMVEESEKDVDFIENLARSQMMAGDSKMTKWWLDAKARTRGWGKEIDRYQLPNTSNEELNKKLKTVSPRERLRLLAEAHQKGEYEGANAQHGGTFQ